MKFYKIVEIVDLMLEMMFCAIIDFFLTYLQIVPMLQRKIGCYRN